MWKVREPNPSFAHIKFDMEEEDMVRFKRAFIDVVENLGITYNVQEAFDMEGYFPMKVTPLGDNLFLRKERDEG